MLRSDQFNIKEKSSFNKKVQLQDGKKYTNSQDMIIDSGIIIGDGRRFRGEKWRSVWSPWWLDVAKREKGAVGGIDVWTIRRETLVSRAIHGVI